MESLRRKRKGIETLDRSDVLRVLSSFRKASASSHLSFEECSRQQKKKCKEQQQDDANSVGSSMNRPTGVVSAPPCSSSSADPIGRGLKRKLGCIESATQIGRKNKLDQEYVLGLEIGEGKFGSVRVCRCLATGAEFACKTLRKAGGESVHREVEIMQHLSGHPNVVTLQAVYEDCESFHLVMELCSGGRLLDQMVREGRYTEQRAANVLKELVSVIKYCHEMGVAHRDIKPENILLSPAGKVKLADFGLAMRVSNGQSLSGVAGSPAYVAPEVLAGDYSEKVDIWSAGVLLHALLVGVLPFQGVGVEAFFEAIKKVKLDFHGGVWESISGPARDLLGRMLTRDVSTRITADEVLRHPWIVFYTERSLRSLTVKAKVRNHSGTSRKITIMPAADLERSHKSNTHLADGVVVHQSLESSSQKSENQDDCGLVDVLAAAISCVTISEPKRTRICSPVSPIQQECSSNMKSNLCTAF
ncbi:hypothetical protein AAC387_Pa04g2852 [Persea americana]|eukprot:TRINITY_DN3173_c1_g1_i1.p1 TRINITY_DN3173_c1_g1~~TRINITY_DN3173_c1_g1_i1.p1  ORF type:complete len:474 (-),score=88.45 TRINITY_DN3173_c1_g1_i1:499-1920(-)